MVLNFNSIAERLRVAMARRDITINAAAKEMEIDPVMLGRICSGSFPDDSRYEKIMTWLVIQEER